MEWATMIPGSPLVATAASILRRVVVKNPSRDSILSGDDEKNKGGRRQGRVITSQSTKCLQQEVERSMLWALRTMANVPVNTVSSHAPATLTTGFALIVCLLEASIVF